jgi:hypothetical protein
MELEAESSRGDDTDKHKSVIFFSFPLLREIQKHPRCWVPRSDEVAAAA